MLPDFTRQARDKSAVAMPSDADQLDLSLSASLAAFEHEVRGQYPLRQPA